jgi:hypothetical protein
MFKQFFISDCFGVLAAAIQRGVDGEDYISHRCPASLLCAGGCVSFEALRPEFFI